MKSVIVCIVILVVINISYFVFSLYKTNNLNTEITRLNTVIARLNEINRTYDTLKNSISQEKYDFAIKMSSEYGFFLGQLASLNRDIRITKDSDGFWVWIKSPNNDDTPPVFDPKTLGKDF